MGHVSNVPCPKVGEMRHVGNVRRILEPQAFRKVVIKGK